MESCELCYECRTCSYYWGYCCPGLEFYELEECVRQPVKNHHELS